MKLAKNERLNLWGIPRIFGANVEVLLKSFTAALNDIGASGNPSAVYEALRHLREIKSAIQHVHNINQQLACLAAKAYLGQMYPTLDWENIDFLEQDVNATGPDMIYTGPGTDFVAYVKTTEPKKPTDFGSQQKASIECDLNNLSSSRYERFERFFFLISPKAAHILQTKYCRKYPLVRCVLLRNADLQEELSSIPG